MTPHKHAQMNHGFSEHLVAWSSKELTCAGKPKKSSLFPSLSHTVFIFPYGSDCIGSVKIFVQNSDESACKLHGTVRYSFTLDSIEDQSTRTLVTNGCDVQTVFEGWNEFYQSGHCVFCIGICDSYSVSHLLRSSGSVHLYSLGRIHSSTCW